MKHIDLFSGIGGFAMAARTVWGAEYETAFFCDNNKFCQVEWMMGYPPGWTDLSSPPPATE